MVNFFFCDFDFYQFPISIIIIYWQIKSIWYQLLYQLNSDINIYRLTVPGANVRARLNKTWAKKKFTYKAPCCSFQKTLKTFYRFSKLYLNFPDFSQD